MAESNTKKERKKKLDLLLSDLKSGEEKKVNQALKGLQVHGDQSVILPLIEVWSEGTSSQVENEIISFLGDLKQNDTAEPIMHAVNKKEFRSLRQKLLTTIWNSKVDYSEYFVDFVRIAVEGDFMEALECLTILENLEGPFEEHQFLDAQVELSVFAEQQNKDEQKKQLISEIALLIKDLEQGHIAF